MFKPIVLLALALAASPGHASQAEYFTAQANGKLTIGADGSVLDVEVRSAGSGQLGGAVEEGFEEHIRAWRFEPVVEDGKPVNAIGHMRLSLVATIATGEKEATLGIRQVWFTDPPSTEAGTLEARAAQQMATPSYPRIAESHQVGGQVMLVVKIGANGSVAEVGTHALELTGNVSAGQLGRERYARPLRQSAERAVKNWTFDGFAEGDLVLVPVRYSPYSTSAWVRTVVVPTQPPAWAVSSQKDKTALALGDDGQRTSTRIKLDTPLKDPMDPASES